MPQLLFDPPICSAVPPVVVWEVESGASGVTDDVDAAEKAMLDALATRAEGRGQVRLAHLVRVGVGYDYGETLVTAHRKDGVTTIVTGDAWVTTP
ncbi:hypothetical protein C1I98_06000 [Spongiactinospora gelatinilytica]|uniref:Uncharacterized protein n=1 Tax=Spongiactinospora gelatinilytica TaxID=2666298 RepID=A0A2W2HT91_9ACTN|nr:hypothetical protein [Spongiactinospora gelatinilytica]PZG53108.1 hypothetical protein C1I98_06000 [Spongiactinospora gelatinilytica]